MKIYKHDYNLAEMKKLFPDLRTICIVGRPGAGKSTLAARAGDQIPANVCRLDVPLFEVYDTTPELLKKLYNVEELPCTKDGHKLHSFHAKYAHRDKETFRNFIKIARPHIENRLCEEILKRQSEMRTENPLQDTSWGDKEFVYTPTNMIKRNTFIMDGFSPGRSVLASADKVYICSTYTAEVANNAAANREKKDTPTELEEFLRGIQVAGEVIEETLHEDLRGLEYVQIVNNHGGQKEMDKLVRRIVKDYHHDIF